MIVCRRKRGYFLSILIIRGRNNRNTKGYPVRKIQIVDYFELNLQTRPENLKVTCAVLICSEYDSVICE